MRRWWVAALLVLIPVALPGQEPVSLDAVAAGLFGKETYCEAGRWGRRDEPNQGIAEIAFSRCAHRDGRFKVLEYVDRPRPEVIWSDSRKLYRHSGAANYYQESALDDAFMLSFPGNRSEVYPIYLSRLFKQSPNDSDRTSARYFQAYKANGALSTPQHSVFERHDEENPANSERLWVRNADKAIVRYEGLRNGVVFQFAEIASQRVDHPLTDADLWHDVSPFTRYSLSNNPAAFLIGLFVAAGVGGALLWARVFSRAASLDEIALKRRGLWRVQFLAAGGVAIVLACLAALALIVPDKGHPPVIVLVFALAMWCAVAFALAAFVTLMSYPVEMLFMRKGRG